MASLRPCRACRSLHVFHAFHSIHAFVLDALAHVMDHGMRLLFHVSSHVSSPRRASAKKPCPPSATNAGKKSSSASIVAITSFTSNTSITMSINLDLNRDLDPAVRGSHRLGDGIFAIRTLVRQARFGRDHQGSKEKKPRNFEVRHKDPASPNLRAEACVEARIVKQTCRSSPIRRAACLLLYATAIVRPVALSRVEGQQRGESTRNAPVTR